MICEWKEEEEGNVVFCRRWPFFYVFLGAPSSVGYRRKKSAISSVSCFRCSTGSQVLSLVGKPFHLTREWSLRPRPCRRTFCISSASYSSSPSIRLGGGRVKFGPCNAVSLSGVRRLAWITG